MEPLGDWGEPVTVYDPEHPLAWTDELVPYWNALTGYVEPAIKDPLVQRHWHGVLERFDAGRPTSVAEVNQGWRELVAGVWNLLVSYWNRQAQARRARRG